MPSMIRINTSVNFMNVHWSSRLCLLICLLFRFERLYRLMRISAGKDKITK